MVDWDLAVLAASKLSGPGPTVSRAEADAVVGQLRADADRSTALVGEYTGLQATERTAPVLVVDRPGWVQANVDGFATVISPLIDRLREKRGAPSPMVEAVGSRVTGLELGALLGFMSSKVLGQFDPFYAPETRALPAGRPASPTAVASPAAAPHADRPAPPAVPPHAAGGSATAGRLLLVAPNIVHVEGELDVDPTDFRLWVCLHEETHRVQFTAVPWMRDHIHGRIAALVESIEIEPGRLAGMLTDGLKRVGDLVRGDDEVSLLDLIQTPEQRAIVDQVTAVMSLLEGHADVVMDGVGPEVIGSVAEIRRKFNRRRTGGGTLDRVVRRLLGVDAKMAQYRNGAIFVRGVVDQVGMAGFNAVWTSPETLPSRAEIGDPEAWVRRVHG
jgi:coenzyme F420 biosynthesis associated uncharacterized protein